MTTPGAARSATQDAPRGPAKPTHFPRSVLSDQTTFSPLRDSPARQFLALAEVTAAQEEGSFRWIAPFCGQRSLNFTSPPAGRQILFGASASDSYFSPSNISAMLPPLLPNGSSPFAAPQSNPMYYPAHSTYDEPAWLLEETSLFLDASVLPPTTQFEQFLTGDHVVLGTSHATVVRGSEENSTAVLEDHTTGAHTSPNSFVRSAAVQQEPGNPVLKSFEILRSSWLPSPPPFLHGNKSPTHPTRKRQASTEINGASAAMDVKKAKKAKKAEKAEKASKSEKAQKESASAVAAATWGEQTTDDSTNDDGIAVSMLAQMFGTTEAATNKLQHTQAAVELTRDRYSQQAEHVTVGEVEVVTRKAGRLNKVQPLQTNDATQSKPAQSRPISGQSYQASRKRSPIRAKRTNKHVRNSPKRGARIARSTGSTMEQFVSPLKRTSSMISGHIISDSSTTEFTMIAETLATQALGELLKSSKAHSSAASNNRSTTSSSATAKRVRAPIEVVQPFVVPARFGALKKVPLLFWMVFTLQRMPDPTTWVHIESLTAAISIIRCTLTKKQTIAGTISTDRKEQATSTIESSGNGYYRLKSEMRPGHPVTEHWWRVLEKYRWTTM